MLLWAGLLILTVLLFLFGLKGDEFMNRLTANTVDWFTNRFDRCWCDFDGKEYDKETVDVIIELLEGIYRIKPYDDEGRRELWIPVDRGDITEYGFYKELQEEDAPEEDFEDCRKYWLQIFPNERMWFRLSTAEYENYRAISINHKTIVNQDITKYGRSGDYEKEFFRGVITAVKEAIAMMENGTYNEIIKKEIAYNYRTGIIQQKDLWELVPGFRDSVLGDLSNEEINEFLNVTEDAGDSLIGKKLPYMTAGIFYNTCATGYQGCKYDFAELSAKEQYYKNADGRDGDLKYVDENSPEAFEEWYESDARMGSHVYEIKGGIYLYPYKTEDGYYFGLSSPYVGRFIETVRFYLALVKAEIPVEFYDIELFRQRLMGTEKGGIVPHNIMTIHCESWFPGEKVRFFENLPEENQEEIIKRVQWQPIEECYLIEEDDEKVIEELIKRLESVDMTDAIPAEQIYEKLGIDPKKLADFDDIDFE